MFLCFCHAVHFPCYTGGGVTFWAPHALRLISYSNSVNLFVEQSGFLFSSFSSSAWPFSSLAPPSQRIPPLALNLPAVVFLQLLGDVWQDSELYYLWKSYIRSWKIWRGSPGSRDGSWREFQSPAAFLLWRWLIIYACGISLSADECWIEKTKDL